MRTPHSTSRRALVAGTALLGAAGLAVASLVLPSVPPAAATSPTTFRGSERYQVRGVFAKSARAQLFASVAENGAFFVGIDDELWQGQVVGTGRDSHVEVTPEQIDAIRDTIARDLHERFASRFVSRADRRRLRDLERRATVLEQERAALQTAYDEAKARVESYLKSGVVSPDILKSLEDARDAAEAAVIEKVVAIKANDEALEEQRARSEPYFDVVVGAMTLTFRFNRARTTVRVKSRILFDVRNEFEERIRHGRRTISGRGPLTP